METRDTLLLESDDLRVCPERGEVSNGRGESTRLGPVNMRVLVLLMSRPGQVVRRDEIFDAVWRNQVVGDGVLTRAISDIRAEVGRLSGQQGFIETLPKRGYRWTVEVRQTSASASAAASATAAESFGEVRNSTSAAGPVARASSREMAPARNRLLAWFGRGTFYLTMLVLLASVAVWAISRFAQAGLPIVALLPVTAEPPLEPAAARIEQALSEYLLGLDQLDLLARSAVQSRPANPFPYFFYEFGATWLVEAELRQSALGAVLVVEVVDARTGIVQFQRTIPLDEAGSSEQPALEGIAAALSDFFQPRP